VAVFALRRCSDSLRAGDATPIVGRSAAWRRQSLQRCRSICYSRYVRSRSTERRDIPHEEIIALPPSGQNTSRPRLAGWLDEQRSLPSIRGSAVGIEILRHGDVELVSSLPPARACVCVAQVDFFAVEAFQPGVVVAFGEHRNSASPSRCASTSSVKAPRLRLRNPSIRKSAW